MQHWYLIKTERYREQQAADAIANLAFQIFLPLETKWNARRRVAIKRPLFAQYLFSKFDLDLEEWWLIEQVRGVKRIVCAQAKPIHIPDQQIEVIRLAEAVGEYDHTKIKMAELEFATGAQVKILTGPFIGLVGQVARATQKRRIEILFSLLGRQSRVEISPQYLEQIA